MATHINVSNIPSGEIYSMVSKLIFLGFEFEAVVSITTDIELYNETIVIDEKEGIVYMDGENFNDSVDFYEYTPRKPKLI